MSGPTGNSGFCFRSIELSSALPQATLRETLEKQLSHSFPWGQTFFLIKNANEKLYIAGFLQLVETCELEI